MPIRLAIVSILLSCLSVTAHAQSGLSPALQQEYARRALVARVNKTTPKGLTWDVGGDHAEAIIAVSGGAMPDDATIKLMLDDKVLHETLRKARFRHLAFSDKKRESLKVFLIAADGFKPSRVTRF